MANLLRILLFCLGLSLCFPGLAWGFEPHRRINEQACLILPKPLFGFYKRHLDYMVAHATDADMRRYIDTNEASKHYIDVEHYGSKVDSIPQSYLEAVELFGEEHLHKEGMLPWSLTKQVMLLKYAFVQQNTPLILKASADLGHYIADAHVPLHTTENYNGQLSNQKGIHALWETRIPQLFLDTILVEQPVFEFDENWQSRLYQTIEESHQLCSLVFKKELEVRQEIPESQWYLFQQQKQNVVKQYSPIFVERYHQKLDGMVENRFVSSAQQLAKLIFTAWVLAGEPELEPVQEFIEPELWKSQPTGLEDCSH